MCAKRKRKFIVPQLLQNLPNKEVEEYLENNVFSEVRYKSNIAETAKTLNIDIVVVEKVMKHYITSVFKTINKFQKFRTKINIYGFFSFDCEEGKFY